MRDKVIGVTIRVEKQDWDELPWAILCSGGLDCEDLGLGINSTVGWEDQETAMRVADRHAQEHSMRENFHTLGDVRRPRLHLRAE